MSAIPCKRPKITVTPRTSGDDRHDADCHVPGCSWTYPAGKQFMALKSDAEEHATRHRAEHRAAVPKIETKHVAMPEGGTRLVEQCQHCGWVTPTGFSTVADRRRKTDEHLVDHHGLVSC